METNALTEIIVHEAYRIHQEIGPGLFESVYECVLANALLKKGFTLNVRSSFLFACEARNLMKVFALI